MAHDTRLVLNEIFFSLQGESSRQGLPCVMVRLTGCNLRCVYCDTPYAYQEGREASLDEIIGRVEEFGCRLVEITGGEPMAQPAAAELARQLLALDFTVMMETNGSFDIATLPDGVIKIVDIKTPGSGAGNSFLWDNLKHLGGKDEIKFVIASRADFDWAARLVKKHGLANIRAVNISPAAGMVSEREAAQWILESGLPLRLNLQLHRILWGGQRAV